MNLHYTLEVLLCTSSVWHHPKESEFMYFESAIDVKCSENAFCVFGPHSLRQALSICGACSRSMYITRLSSEDSHNFKRKAVKRGQRCHRHPWQFCPGSRKSAWLSLWQVAKPEAGLGIKDGLCQSHKQ